MDRGSEACPISLIGSTEPSGWRMPVTTRHSFVDSDAACRSYPPMSSDLIVSRKDAKVIHHESVCSLLHGPLLNTVQVEGAIPIHLCRSALAPIIPPALNRDGLVGEELGIDGSKLKRHEFGPAKVDDARAQ